MDGGQLGASIAALALYGSWLGLRPWFPRAARILLSIVNLATALGVAVYDVIPLRYVLEDWRLQAIVAFELVAIAAATAALMSNRAALYFSYLAFAIHFCAIAWTISHPLTFGGVLNYG